MKTYILLLSLLFPCSIFAQVNTEKMKKHQSEEGFVYNAEFRVGYASGNINYTTIDGSARIDYNQEKFNTFLVGNYNYKKTPEKTIIHKGFAHVRFNREINEKSSVEAFLQQEFNELLLLDDRKVVGASFRTHLLNIKNKKDSLTEGFRSNLGIGGMYEIERYDLSGIENNTQEAKYYNWRITSYLTLDWSITKDVNYWCVMYYQPNINNFSDFRSIVESGLDIRIIGHLLFTFGVGYRYNNEPVGGKKQSDLLLINGLALTY